jgi:site-specific DNA-methyltransferase (adenine-specific)
MTFDIHHSECVAFMRTLPDNSIDAIVTDPPYGLSFMGKRWDYDVPSEDVWKECLRVLKPGGHLLAFAGTRTQHRMAVRIEDAGFEIRDMIAWVYGSGFPKSLDVSKAIDKASGAEREVVDTIKKTPSASSSCNEGWVRPWAEGKTTMDITAPATPAAKTWQGWGTALKPALEPITVARKPFTGTVAANVLEYGTGAINVDGCRVGTEESTARPVGRTAADGWRLNAQAGQVRGGDSGRWPANLIHDGSDEVVGLFPQAGGGNGKPIHAGDFGKHGRYAKASGATTESYADSGSAARFFYCAKASKRDRDEGLEEMKSVVASVGNKEAAGRDGTNPNNYTGGQRQRVEAGLPATKPRHNHHPTVKPTDLMRYLCRLVTPPNGTVLDPFMGSGSTGKAAVLEGFNFIGCDMTAEYVDIARARITHAFNSQPNKLDI